MTGPPGVTRQRLDLLRHWVVAVAALVVVLAVVVDPGAWSLAVLLVVPLAAFVAWERWPGLPLPPLALVVIGPVVLAQYRGQLEPSMFLATLFGLVAARRERRRWLVVAASLVVVALPTVVVAVQPQHNRISWATWTVGMAVAVLLGGAMRREERLLLELAEARNALATQAQAEERRRIARDVHDLVGHGLAAVLLQVTSARHVLRRDPDAADEALRTAELAGRRSLAELRGTVTLLRGSPAESVLPLPELGQLDELVADRRADGLTVDYRPSGDLAGLPPALGLAFYRIAQEALTNAAKHAPRARTVVAVTAGEAQAVLEVTSTGPTVPPAAGTRPRYGLVGMRERAATVGADLRAGPTEAGWQVRCVAPVPAP